MVPGEIRVNVLNIHAGQDTGGQGIRIKRAFDRHAPEWTYRACFDPKTFEYLGYPTDLPWRDAKDAWAAADLVHLRNDFRTARMFERRRGEKPAVVHYHGTLFRTDPFARLAEQRRRGAIGLVSTLDLWLIAPDETEWVPAPYDLEWLTSLRP